MIEGEVISPNDESVYVTAAYHPFKLDLKIFNVSAGMTLQEILEIAQPDPILRHFAHITIGDSAIIPEYWSNVRPKPGTRVYIRVLPQKAGGSKGLIRIVMMVAMVAASIAFPVLFPATAALTVLGGALTVGQLVAAGIMLVGAVLLSVIAPVPKPKMRTDGNLETDSPTLFITGSQNQFYRFGVVPRVLGRHRMITPYGALPFSESQGNDQYMRFIFVYGYGPVTVEDRRIGETLLTEFDDVEQEFKRGWPQSLIQDQGNWDASSGAFPASPSFGYRYTVSVAGTVDGTTFVIGDTIIFNGLASSTDTEAWDLNHDKPFKLYPQDVLEESLNVSLTQEIGWVLRTSRPNADELSVDIAFPTGLSRIGGLGHHNNITVQFEVESSPTGLNTWTSRGSHNVTAAQSSAVVKNVRWFTEARDQYDIRIRRVTADTDDTAVLDDSMWSTLRTITNEDPINFDGLAAEAIRIRATDQLKGVIDQYNAIVTSILKYWDGSNWVWGPTSHPEACFRTVLQDHANAHPQDDSRLHLDSLEEFGDYCIENEFEYNKILDTSESVREVLMVIAAVGKASIGNIDGKWGVTIDKPVEVPVQHFTPRNSWDFEGERPYIKLPHAWRIPFINADAGWNIDERIVYNDGYNENGTDGNAAATIFQELEFPGITHADHIWKLGRFHFAQLKLRPDRYKLSCDFEYLIARRGSLVLISHHVISAGLFQARIKSVVLDVDGKAVAVVMDELVTMEAGFDYGVAIRSSVHGNIAAEVVTNPTETNTIHFVTPISASALPEEGDLLTFGYLGQETLECIVLRVEPQEGDTAILTLQDAAPAVHQAHLGVIPDYESFVSVGVEVLYPAVTGIESDEQVLIVNPDGSWIAQIQLQLGFAGRRPQEVQGLQARYRIVGSEGTYTFVDAAPTAGTIYLQGVTPGSEYEIQTRYKTTAGYGKWGPLLTHTVIGPLTPPPSPTNMRLSNGQIHWDYPAFEDVPDLKGFQIKFNRLVSDNWATGELAHTSTWASSPFPTNSLPNGIITVMVKAIDLANNESLTHISMVITDEGVSVENVLDIEDYAAAGFPGDITGATVAGTELEADTGAPFWSNPSNLMWASDDTDLMWIAVYEEVIYVFDYTPPVGLLSSDFLTVSHDIDAEHWNLTFQIVGVGDMWVDDGDDMWGSDSDPMWVGEDTPPSSVPARIQNLQAATYRFTLTLAGSTIQGIVHDLAIIVGAESIEEFFTNIAIASGGTRLAITKTYRDITFVGLTVLNDGGAAVTSRVQDDDEVLGPAVQGLTISGTGTDSHMNAHIRGY